MRSKGDEEGRGGGRRLALPLSEGSQPARHPPGAELSPQPCAASQGLLSPRTRRKEQQSRLIIPPAQLTPSELPLAPAPRTAGAAGTRWQRGPQCPRDVPRMSPGWLHNPTNCSNSPQFLQHQHRVYPVSTGSCRGSGLPRGSRYRGWLCRDTEGREGLPRDAEHGQRVCQPWEGWKTAPAVMCPSGKGKHRECLEGEGRNFCVSSRKFRKTSSLVVLGQSWSKGIGKTP